MWYELNAMAALVWLASRACYIRLMLTDWFNGVPSRWHSCAAAFPRLVNSRALTFFSFFLFLSFLIIIKLKMFFFSNLILFSYGSSSGVTYKEVASI
jgi:hypothetical protein